MSQIEVMGKIFDHIEGHKELYESWLYRICEQRSISATGDGVAECAVLVADLCEEVGLSVEWIETPRHPVLVARMKGRSKYTLGFYDHYDVQPVDPIEKWDSEPFVPTLRGDRLYARGVADNKGNFISRLAAIEAWIAVVDEIPVNVCFILDGDEEIGSPGLNSVAEFLEETVDIDGLIWESGSLNAAGELVSYEGVKGIVSIELTAVADRDDLHSMYATVVSNPAWRLTGALSSFWDEDGRISIPGFFAGTRAETGIDHEELAKYCRNEAKSLRDLGARTDLEDFELVRQHVFGATLNLSGMTTGYVGPGSKSVLPAKATARLDARLIPDQNPDNVVKAVREHLHRGGYTDIEIRVLGNVPPFRSVEGTRLSSAVRAAAAKIYAGYIVYPTLAAAGPMHALCAKRGIPASAAPGTADHLSAFHAPNESIQMVNFYKAIRGIALVLENLGSKAN